MRFIILYCSKYLLKNQLSAFLCNFLQHSLRYGCISLLLCYSQAAETPKEEPYVSYSLFEECVKTKEIPYQGWKIFVSAAPESLQEIRKAMNPLLNGEYNYKIVKSLDCYKRLNTNPDELGKYITFYPRNFEEALDLTQKLHSILSEIDPSHFMEIPNCLKIGKSNGLYTRYGQYKQNHLKSHCVLKISEENQFLFAPTPQEFNKAVLSSGKVFIFDDREKPYPDFIDPNWCPFKELLAPEVLGPTHS